MHPESQLQAPRISQIRFLPDRKREIIFNLEIFQFIQNNLSLIFEVLKSHKDVLIRLTSQDQKAYYKTIGAVLSENKKNFNLEHTTWIMNLIGSVVNSYHQKAICNDILALVLEHTIENATNPHSNA